MHRSEYPVAFMCRVLGVTSSGYNAWRRRGPSRRAEADRVLQRRIEEIHQASRGIYGWCLPVLVDNRLSSNAQGRTK